MSVVIEWVDKWLLTCWPGIECGDAGGWASGIATFAAVAFAFYQMRREELRRKAEKAEQLGVLANLLIPDVLFIGNTCEAAINMLHDKKLDQLSPIQFRHQFALSNATSLSSAKALFGSFQIDCAAALSGLLAVLESQAKKNWDICNRVTPHYQTGHDLAGFGAEDMDVVAFQYGSVLELCVQSLLQLHQVLPIHDPKKTLYPIAERWAKAHQAAAKVRDDYRAATAETLDESSV